MHCCTMRNVRLQCCSAFQSWSSGGSYGSRLGVATWPRISRSIHCTLHTAHGATHHDQFTAQRLHTAQSCLQVSYISRSYHCTLHHDLFSRVLGNVSQSIDCAATVHCTIMPACEQYITINSMHTAHCT